MKRSDIRKRANVQKTLSGFSFPNFEYLQSKDNPKFKETFAYALNYANYTFSHEQLKHFAQKYSIFNLKKILDWEFYHIGIMIWLKQNGTDFNNSEILKINQNLFELFDKYEKKKKKTIINQKEKRTLILIGELEGFIDDFDHVKKDYEIPNKLIEKAGKVDIKEILAHFENRFNEFINFMPDFANKQSFVIAINIIRDSLNMVNQKPVKRKTRIIKPKKINPTKMVKKLNYLKSIENNKYVSIDPERIIGANTLWVWNTKSKKLGKYIAKPGETLSVKGSTIQNFEEISSIEKKIRKPDIVLSELMTSGKVYQRKLLNTVKAVEKQLTGRINKYQILIKVYQ